jgi:hypothetical protein
MARHRLPTTATGLFTPPSLPERQFDPFEHDVVDFAPLPEGRLPYGLIERLREVDATVNDSGPPLSALGLPWCPGGSGRGSVLRLGMNRSPTGFLGRSTALGEGRDRHHTTTLQRHSTTIDLFFASPQLIESNFIFELSVRVWAYAPRKNARNPVR